MEPNLVFNSPKNFKRGKYIFGRFRLKDALIILSVFAVSLVFVILYLNIFQQKNILINIVVVLLCLLPDLVVYLLFLPMPVYLHVLEFISAFRKFHTRQRKFKWEGIHQFEDERSLKNEH